MHDDSELKERLLTLFGPGPVAVTADEAMGMVTEWRRVPSQKLSPRISHPPRRTALLWLAGVVVLVVALVVGFGPGFGSTQKPGIPTSSTPPTWRHIAFGGISLAVPESWPVRSEDKWGDCAAAGSPLFVSSSVVLDTGAVAENFGCPAMRINPPSSIPLAYGIVIDPGRYGPLRGQSIGRCTAQGGLRVCPSTDYGGIEVYAVYVPGRTQPVAVEVGLAGGGNNARTILDSMRATSPLTTRTTTTTTKTSTTTTTTPKQTLPPLNVRTLPVPTDYSCPPSLYALSPANEAAGDCVPYAYLVGGSASNPSNNTACPAGSFMTMGPVECSNENGIVAAVSPGPNTCTTPGGPCPSSTLPLSSRASVIPWSVIQFPMGNCSAGYYFGDTNGIATCVPYTYLPGGTSTNPNNDKACPAGSGLKVVKLTGTLCTQDAEPYDIVAPHRL